MRVLARSFCLVLVILILACATVAQAKTSLRRVSKISAASLKITPQVLRGKIIFLRGDDVWMFDPRTRREQILFKGEDDSWVVIVSREAGGFDFSPDLKSLVIQSFRSDFIGNDLSIINLETGETRKLVTSAPEVDLIQMRFSPDGKKISYTKSTGGHDHFDGDVMEIRMINSDGSDEHRVIGDVSQSTYTFSDAYWSCDGKRLLFLHEGLGKSELQTCALDGSGVKPFDGNYGAFLRSDVSLDGKLRVAREFLYQALPAYPIIRLYPAQKNKLIRDLVTNQDLVFKNNPQWSADSKRIIFQARQLYTRIDSSGYAREVQSNDLWAVSPNGKNLRRIVKNANYLLAVL